MKSKFSKILTILLIGIFCISLSGCGKETTKDTGKTTQSPEKKNLKIVDTSKNSRPYAVMINNISVARPLQSGLQD